MSTLYLGNLSSHVQHRELENVFRRFGRSYLELKDGYGFVVYEEFRDAQKALRSLQGRSVCGEQPSIKWARGKRSFPRNSGREPPTRRGSWDKHQSQPMRTRKSVETDRRSDDCKEEVQVIDEVWFGSRASDTRENTVRSSGKGEEWKEEEKKDVDVDPLDSGRWDPHMEDSPPNMILDGLIEDEEDILDGKGKEDQRGSTHERAHGSPGERHNEGSSRDHRNSCDHARRGRDIAGRLQERCYNCGQFGHVKWQCRSRPRQPSMRNGRRVEARYLGGRGGFRGAFGRFRGMNGSRRMFQNDVERDFTGRSSRRHDTIGHKRHHDPLDAKSLGKTKRRHHRSKSPNDSSSRGRSKRKYKRFSNKSSSSSRKCKRSSSSSLSCSTSGHSSSSSPSGSSSTSRSGSDSPSAASSRSSSRSGSRSSSSLAPSPLSKGRSSRSCSSSSSSSQSRSRSATSGSRKSISRFPSHSHSPRTNGTALTDSALDSRSSRREEDREGAIADKPTLQSKQMSDINHNRDVMDDADPSPENQELDQQEEARSSERRRVWSREMKQKPQTKTYGEVPRHATHIDTKGGNHGVNSRKWADPQCSVMQNAECLAMDRSATARTGQIIDTKYNMYMAIRRGADGGQMSNSGFAMARMWPLEAILYRRLKRGLITTANYERRKAQNLEFGIEDKFVRSSSGWWEEDEQLNN